MLPRNFQRRTNVCGSGPLIIVVVVLVLGYFAMFIAVVSESSWSQKSYTQGMFSSSQNNIQSENERIVDTSSVAVQNLRATQNANRQLEDLKLSIVSKDKEIEELKGDLLALSEEKKSSKHQTSTIRPGVIILGMHRSGTSVLGGLMSKMQLQTGGPLIAPAEDNKKGFFERIDVVLQNDAIMQRQGIYYAGGCHNYDHVKGIRDVLTSTQTAEILGKADIFHLSGTDKFFNEGRRGLHFLNNPANYPWMLKDPRLCITIRTWLPLLNFVPAVVFTFRHPLGKCVQFF